MDKSYDDGPMRHSQLRRLAIFLAGTLIVVSLTSYAALAFELTRHKTASTGALFNVINSFHTFTDTRPWADEHEHDVAGEDRFTLHPEQHVFRQPHKIRLEWNVTKESRAPDGVSKDIYLINGKPPSRSPITAPVTHATQVSFLGRQSKRDLATSWKYMLQIMCKIKIRTASPSIGTACI